MNRVSYRPSWQKTLGRATLTAMLIALCQVATAESEYAAAWGPSLGSTAPQLEALDQSGKPQNLETLKGSNGLLFVFNRSVDW